MNKGIVMDIKKHNVVVLTPNGEFITCKRKGNSYMVGEEISFNEEEQRSPRFAMPPFLKPASILVACFLCVFLFFYNQPEEKVFAYVSVDINPSLEASVTKDLRVIDLRACNDDGRRILKEIKQWENKHVHDVIRTIIKQSQEDEYLTNDKQVMLTAVTKDKTLEPQLEKAMKELKKEYETKHVSVVYQSSTMQMRENAMKAGVGTGVYIKRENDKQKSLTPPAPPSNQEERDEEIHSQQKSSSDISSDSSPVKEEIHDKQEYIEQKQYKEQQPKQIKENNGHQQENNGRGSQQGNNGHQQENNGRESQGNNGHQQENNGRGSQGNNGHQQENNGRGSQQGNNGHQQESNGRESQGNNGHQQENNGRESQGNNGHQQENNGRESQGNNGHQQENNGRGSQQGNINENNGPKNEDKNIPATQHQGNEKKNP
ncbi:anti-sigma factor domain-containing protein [Bacillus hominis]|uniref:Anti-sigma factor domain-containing protein n=1 Tax=Bacillus hominis TaxID=2817478 RepID=A0ABT7RAF3_9BACI|nr:anti-sigma factor domain-containing protein [Bacillus hominis]MDM5194449.1 anti-sigma factor domain-containing protein [Bacillus hominis]MDM5434152.1 anti-sigma factor domain-containing protein [Bacillus hominis]MDM5439574.1 anti-sigma factor domain-containing protein [Bacillus hominis]